MKKSTKKISYAAIGAAVLAMGGTTAWADSETPVYTLDPIVVTATKTETKASETAANVNVVTREQIEKNHYQDLTDALKDVPGVTVGTYGAGSGFEYSSQVAINGSSQIVVLVDGVRANTNGSDMSVFPAGFINDMNNIERIEVLKGAASSLYGSDAKGGVINIITRKAERNQTTVTLAGGSYDREDYNLTNSGKSGNYSWFVNSQKDISGNYSDGRGNTIPSYSDSTTNSVRLSRKLGEGSDLTFDWDRYQGDYRQINSADNFASHSGNNDNTSWKLTYRARLSDTSSNQFTLYQNEHNMHDGTNADSSSIWNMDMKTKGLQDQFTQRFNNNTLVAGLDVYQDHIDYSYKSYYYGMWYGSQYNGKVTNSAVYLQDEWNITGKFKLTAGLREDHHSVYGNYGSPSISLNYKQDKNTDFYVSYKKYFVAPNLDELYDTLYGGNKNLKPETGHTVEAGVNHKFGKSVMASAHVFETSSDNAIAFVGTMSGGQYTNLNREVAHGWDIQVNAQLTQGLTAYTNYTHTTYNIEGTDVATPVMGYAHLPEGMWNIGVDYKQPAFDIGLHGHGNVHLPGQLPTNSYWVWDAVLNVNAGKHAVVFLKAYNLFNQYYAVFGSPKDGYYTCPGRNFRTGVTLKF